MPIEHAAFRAVKHLDHRDVISVLSAAAEETVRRSSSLVHQLAPLVCAQQLLRSTLGQWTASTSDAQLATELNLARSASGVLVLQRLQAMLALLEAHCDNIRDGRQAQRFRGFDLVRMGQADLGALADEYASNPNWPDDKYWMIWMAMAAHKSLRSATPVSTFTALVAQAVVNLEAAVVHVAEAKSCKGGMLDELLRIRAHALGGDIRYAALARQADVCLEQASGAKAQSFLDASLRAMRAEEKMAGRKPSPETVAVLRTLQSDEHIDAEEHAVYSSVAAASAHAAKRAGEIIQVAQLAQQVMRDRAASLHRDMDKEVDLREEYEHDIATKREMKALEDLDEEGIERVELAESIRKMERGLINLEEEEASGERTSFGRGSPEMEDFVVAENEMPSLEMSEEQLLELAALAEALPENETIVVEDEDGKTKTLTRIDDGIRMETVQSSEDGEGETKMHKVVEARDADGSRVLETSLAIVKHKAHGPLFMDEIEEEDDETE